MIRYALCVIALAAGSVKAEADGWKAGAAKVNITPPELMWMSGYAGRTKPAEGKLTDLWAKALALEDPSGRRAVVVTMDLVGIERNLSVEVCAELAKKHKLPREAVLLSVSHTHSGPVVRSNLGVMYDLDKKQKQLVADYAILLRAKLVKVASEALENVRPVKLTWGIGTAAFAVNRRNNKEKDVPKLREAGMLKGPVDHDVPVLAVRDAKGKKLVAVLFGYACHATVLGDYEWSGDYPGFAQIELEKAYPGSLALFWAGCGGDQNPLPRRTVALAQDYGKQLAGAVSAALNKPMKEIGGNLGAAYAETELPFAELPTREKLGQDLLSKNKYEAARARLLLKRLDAKELRGTYPYPVQAWRLGDGPTWVALGGEVVVDYALRLKKELGASTTWVAGYANDVMAYIPSLRVLKEGGYEGGGAMVYYGMPTVWSPRVEELIVAAVHEQVKRTRQGAARDSR